MNNSSTSTNSTGSSPVTAEAISRRAYELWEKEGRPQGSDLRHWLQAEQEYGMSRSDTGETPSATPTNSGSDVRPLQGTRAAGAANRDSKRGSSAPVGGDKQTGRSGTTQSTGKRRSHSTPGMEDL